MRAFRANVEFPWKGTLVNDTFPRNEILVALFVDYYLWHYTQYPAEAKCTSVVVKTLLLAFNLTCFHNHAFEISTPVPHALLKTQNYSLAVSRSRYTRMSKNFYNFVFTLSLQNIFLFLTSLSMPVASSQLVKMLVTECVLIEIKDGGAVQ